MSSDQRSDGNETEGKSRPFELQKRRKRRRPLVVPETENDLSFLYEAYCGDDDNVYTSSTKKEVSTFDTSASSSQRRNFRPLPSTQVLTSLLNESRSTRDVTVTGTKSSLTKPSLLLRNFYKSIGMKELLMDKSSEVELLEGDESDKNKPGAVDEIYDPSLSTLKIGHHRRYLKLTNNGAKQQQTSKLNFAQRKEVGKLRQLIAKEQALYRLALDKFHENYKSRYLIGFESDSLGESSNDAYNSEASAFCRWASFRVQSINREWEKRIVPGLDTDISTLPKCYGKVRQTLALHYRTQQSSLDVQDLICSVVHESQPRAHVPASSLSSSLPVKLPELSTKDVGDDSTSRKISPPSTDLAPPIEMIRDDKKAIELALKHSAAIVTTSETLETLLRLPGQHSSKWMLPCNTRKMGSKSVTFLDLSIAQAFSSPRSCLELGLQEGAYQTLLEKYQTSQNDKEKKFEHMTPVSQNVYSLWTLPTKNAGSTKDSRKPIRILVRTQIRLRDSTSKLPIRIRTRVEYFNTPVSPESRSRKEVPNSYERSLWILDQILFGHRVFGLQYRVDPKTCEVVGWDTTSVAHAFASSQADDIQSDSKSHHSNTSPLDHWKALIQLLQSIPSIDMPDTLLCLPGLIAERKSAANETGKESVLGEKGSSVLTNNKQEQIRLNPFSVSVHSSCDSPNKTSDPRLSPPGTIRLDKGVLDHAGAVMLGDQALRDCRREWEWDRNDLVPNTFPMLPVDKIEH